MAVRTKATRTSDSNRRTVTKSIRLTGQEARALAKVVETGPFSEAALMKQWVLAGLQRHKLEEAIQAYMRREVSIGEGAARADVSYHRFWEELERRNVVMLEDPQFLQRLEEIAEAFNMPDLAMAARAAAAEESSGHPRA